MSWHAIKHAGKAVAQRQPNLLDFLGCAVEGAADHQKYPLGVAPACLLGDDLGRRPPELDPFHVSERDATALQHDCLRPSCGCSDRPSAVGIRQRVSQRGVWKGLRAFQEFSAAARIGPVRKRRRRRNVEAGYLGVGNMGQPMAHKLLDAGHNLTVYDINEAAMQPLLERQARRATSPQDLADRCEIVFVSLPTLGAFREVAFGSNGLDKGSALKLLVKTCPI